MKIVFVVEHFYPYVGGAEELFLNLCKFLADLGYDVRVVTTLHSDSLKKHEEYDGIKIYRVPCKNRFLFTILSFPEVFKQSKNADFIHTTSYNSAIPAFFAGLIRRTKVLITFHEVWGKLWFKLPFYPKWKLTGFYLFEWLILKLPFYRYIAVSESTRDALVKHGVQESRIEQIYNGLAYEPLKNFHYDPPKNFTFCFYGRLGISKGIDILIPASAQFIKYYPEVRLKLIIPTYPESLFFKVTELIKASKIEDNLILLHDLSREELLAQVSSSTCIIIPSQSEGFCYVAVESAAMGVPIISSGKGALAETVSGKHLTIKCLNIQSVFEALKKAMNNEWEYSELKKFSLEESTKRYLSLYSSNRHT